MPGVYLETTILSYLTSEPSRDLIVAANQKITRDWWRTAAKRYELFVSEIVIREISAGDPRKAAARLEIVSEVPILAVSPEVDSLTEFYQQHFQFPEKVKADLIHIATAVYYEIDYLASWNCRHIANGDLLRRLLQINRSLDRFTPLLLTPAELMEDKDDD
jgi:hypothetical protein